MSRQIPAIDFSSACCSDGSTATAAAAQDLVHAMETVGFVYLDNVPGFDKQREQRLHEEAKWFFSLPLEEKLLVAPKNWNKQSSNVYRGYVPINVEQGHMREQYEMGGDLPADDPDRCAGNPLYEPTPWPSGERGEVFHQLIISHHSAMLDAAMKFMQLLLCGLGLNRDHFDHKFVPKSTSSVRIMHYPTYRVTGEQRLTCEEHFDSTFVTLLATCSYEGLEILMEDGVWLPVEPRPGSLVVNIGDLLSRLTGRRFKATQHRVQDIGKDRFSLPFFLEPRFDGEFEFPLESRTITYGPWVIQHLRRHKFQYGHLEDYPPKTNN